MAQKQIGSSKQPTEKECLLFLNGYGDGNGDGYGDGYGYFDLTYPYYKVDGIWCKFVQIHGNYAKVIILDMYNSENCKKAYIAKDGCMFAHGETLKDARNSLLYKLSDRDTSPFKEWKLDDVKTKKELIRAYRAITGACEFGTRHFCESVKLPNKATIAEAIKITHGQYGSERFEQFFN